MIAVGEDNGSNLEAVAVTVDGGTFYIVFGDPPESLSNQLLFQVKDLNPKQGCWQVPQWYLDKVQETKDS